jgi:predicted porin
LYTGNSGSFANSQNYIQLESKTFGGIKVGAINSSTLTAVTGVGAPGFSTAVGSSYSSSFSVHDGFNTGTTGFGGIVNVSKTSAAVQAGARAIRMANTLQYQTPVIAGFQATLAIAAKNDNGAPGVAATNANGTNQLTATRGAATAAVDTVGMKEVALRYTNGPLDLMATKLQYVSPAGATTYGASSTTGTQDLRSTQTVFAGNLAVLPTLKVYAAAGGSRMIAATELLSIDSKFRQYGVSFDVTPVASVFAQSAKVDDKTIADIDRKLTSVGANYMLSKRTRVYYRADRIIYNIENPDGIGNKQTRSALGLSHSF